MSTDRELIETLRTEMKEGFLGIKASIGKINNRIDLFETNVNSRFDGIGKYLISIDSTMLKFEKRLNKIEKSKH